MNQIWKIKNEIKANINAYKTKGDYPLWQSKASLPITKKTYYVTT